MKKGINNKKKHKTAKSEAATPTSNYPPLYARGPKSIDVKPPTKPIKAPLNRAVTFASQQTDPANKQSRKRNDSNNEATENELREVSVVLGAAIDKFGSLPDNEPTLLNNDDETTKNTIANAIPHGVNLETMTAS